MLLTLTNSFSHNEIDGASHTEEVFLANLGTLGQNTDIECHKRLLPGQ